MIAAFLTLGAWLKKQLVMAGWHLLFYLSIFGGFYYFAVPSLKWLMEILKWN